MLIDYLRYVAFNGRLRDFFTDAVFDYVERSATTGQHLRFAPEYVDAILGWRGQRIVRDLYWTPHSRDEFEELKDQMGLWGGGDSLAHGLHRYEPGQPPQTFTYRERELPKLEIIVDIHPEHWAPRYCQRAQYHDTPVIYRRAGPAKGNFASGDKMFDAARGPMDYGTLCGFFSGPGTPSYALTCGHVAGSGGEVLIEHRHRIWKLPLWSKRKNLGKTLAQVDAELDAALITVDLRHIGNDAKLLRLATIKPISTMLQDEPVWFRGAGRASAALARISAITVRKSIDVFRDGVLREVGDVLMLGHRHARYAAQPVCRGGDSGAAVRQGLSAAGPFDELSQWHGMILGGDDGSAFASYSEYLWAWAAAAIGTADLEFVFEA